MTVCYGSNIYQTSENIQRQNINTTTRSLIGRASLARENEAGGSWGQEVHNILHVNI